MKVGAVHGHNLRSKMITRGADVENHYESGRGKMPHDFVTAEKFTTGSFPTCKPVVFTR